MASSRLSEEEITARRAEANRVQTIFAIETEALEQSEVRASSGQTRLEDDFPNEDILLALQLISKRLEERRRRGPGPWKEAREGATPQEIGRIVTAVSGRVLLASTASHHIWLLHLEGRVAKVDDWLYSVTPPTPNQN